MPAEPLARLLAYARTSTADQQNPEESLRWQLEAARALIAGRAEIVAVAHNKDTSRSLPWSQRKEAAAILKQLEDPRRPWTGIVVGEPQRAFGDTGQVQIVLAKLAHYDVAFWVPELGGPVDPSSEIHDIILSLFGGLSRAERNRLRVRVKTSMRAMAPEGRYLGGRPPYGYQLVRTGVPHPNPEKARQGVELTKLAVDPETSEVVRQIFAWRANGLGFRAIASRLTGDGVPCPSSADRERNPHRLGRAWSVNAVRAIVINPKYKGTQAYGRYHKVERLRDVDNPAAGHVTREVPSRHDDVVTIAGIVESIIDEGTWQAAQPGTCPSRPGPSPDRPARRAGSHAPPTESRYALRGLLLCAACGRRMQGNQISRGHAEPRVGYRCVYRDEYPGDHGHPRSIFVAEARIVPVLDDWLGALSSKSGDHAIAEMLLQAGTENPEPPDIARARRVVEEAQTKLERYMDAIEKGMDPDLYITRSRTAQAELAAAKAMLETHRSSAGPPLGEDQLRDLVQRVGSVVGLLEDADADERRHFYQELGLKLEYQRLDGREKVRASLGVEFSRVGGGT
ncbi:MAG: recombinase family protein [Acidimicrobiales bacterium]